MDLTSSLMEALSGSAKCKRIEQLKRWEDSETNKEPPSLKERSRKINFSDGCVFLAACSAGDKEEVKSLLNKGADIDTCNVDGLTALHQSCIDDNLHNMVEFLVENGADINRGDNEGWTPLHATASCGFTSIAKYLIENGANVAAVNNDGELPIDIAESDQMEELLQNEIDKLGIDCEAVRNEEERVMLEDATLWLSSGNFLDRPHPKTGATALHVASAKGYIKVMNALLQAGANIDIQDSDGWTPLHAASHWGQKEACELLVDRMCDMEIKNFSGQTVFDVADSNMDKLLEELRKKQIAIRKERPPSQSIVDIKIPPPPRRKTSITRISGADKTQIIAKDKLEERAQIETTLLDNRKRIEAVHVDGEDTPVAESEVEKRNKANRKDDSSIMSSMQDSVPPKVEDDVVPTRIPPKQTPTPPADEDDETMSWHRRLRKSESSEIIPRSAVTSDPLPVTAEQEVGRDLTRPTSLESAVRKDEPQEPTTASSREESWSKLLSDTNSPTISTPNTPSGAQVRRSFVPPVRDEESETQRKAHAKRVRETRRSTQGVTLEDVKSAEQLIKKQTPQEGDTQTTEKPTHDKPCNKIREPSSNQDDIEKAAGDLERRPSRRRQELSAEAKEVTNGSRAAPDVNSETPVTTPAYIRRRVSSTSDNTLPGLTTASGTVRTRLSKSDEGLKDQDKENDSGLTSSSATAIQATQAAIHRRRRPKRRSTGVPNADGDEQDNGNHIQDDSKNDDSCFTDRAPVESSFRSRFGSGSSEVSNRSESTSSRSDRYTSASSMDSTDGSEGKKDYKKCYEEVKSENERLLEKLKRLDQELEQAKHQTELNQSAQRNSVSDADKRERRALERKVSEMEEDLKQLDQLKIDNQRLRDENGALIRVISKLSK